MRNIMDNKSIKNIPTGKHCFNVYGTLCEYFDNPKGENECKLGMGKLKQVGTFDVEKADKCKKLKKGK